MAIYYDPNDPYAAMEDQSLPQMPTEPEIPSGTVPPTPPTTPTVPPTTPAASPWHTAPADGNWQAWFRTNLGRGTLTPAELQALAPDLLKAGVGVITNAGCVAGKVRLPNGQIIDVIKGAAAGGNEFVWQPVGADGTSPLNTSQMSVDPSFLAPWTGNAPGAPSYGPFVAPEGTGTVAPFVPVESFQTPEGLPMGADGSFLPPTFKGPGDFAAPTGADVLADPSYLWRRDQTLGAVENAAAAKGVLNSGGTLYDIANVGGKMASQEYGNVWDRAYNAWNAKWGNALNEYNTNLAANTSAYDRALAAWQAKSGSALDAYNTNLNAKNSTFSNALSAYTANANTADSAYNKAWQQYTDAKDSWYRNQNEPWSKLYQAASLGAAAAG